MYKRTAYSIQNAVDVSVAPDGVAYSIPTPLEIEASFDRLARAIEWHRNQRRRIVVVQGLGFVGTAVAAAIAAARDAADQPLYFVVVVDLPLANSYWKVARLNEGLSPVISPDPELANLIHDGVLKSQNLCSTVSEQVYSLANVIVVDVPLDVRDRFAQAPADVAVVVEDFETALRPIGRLMHPDALVLIETTVPIGTCERVVLPILEEERARRGITHPPYLAHSYERVMPGPNYVSSVRRYWRSFAGIDQVSANKAREFLSSFVDGDSYPIFELENTASSECAKLLENSYRAVNIAFIQEWTLLAERIGIDLFSVVDSIRVRKGTHDNMRFPGFGVGGYCLTKDTLLAQWSSTSLLNSDVVLNMSLNALRINNQMPFHTLDLLTELSEHGLAGETIAVCGVSYLPEVPDTRNSPTELLVNELIKSGSTVLVHDPYLTTWPEQPKVAVTDDLTQCLRHADGVVFAVPHRNYRCLSPRELLDGVSSPPFIVDAQNIITDEKARCLHEAGCRLLGVGKGHWRRRGYQCRRAASAY